MQTFLFTDVEGSTRLWERHPAAMGEAIARQERILRDAIGVRGGAVFNTAGDSVCAVFSEPERAVAAAIDAQRSLQQEPWDDYAPGLRIAVRMAIDAGDAETSDGSFVGPVLNRLHRLMKTGHGGQILCTGAIALDDLGPDLRLRDLGSHPLRDIAGETQLFQVVAPALPVAFPPLVTERPLPRQLPLPPVNLFGRERELEEVDALLRDRKARLVTLLGPGGVGKTSVALALGRSLVDTVPDGVHFIDLSALRDGDLVLPAVAGALQIEDPLLSLEDALISQLRQRWALLILDNCEQVSDAVAAIVQRLIGETDSVTVLVTSRTPLRLRGEHEVHIEPFSAPADAVDPDRHPAVQLFAEQARQIDSRFALSESNRPAVIDICRLVDGLPLAIELAAAWVRILDPVTLRIRLADGAPLLKSGTRDRPERHRTLTSTIDWSYQLLSPKAQWAFGRLAVFQGGIPFDGAMAVLQDGDHASFVEALELVDTLVQANLVQAPIQTADGPRYGMLQTIQEFGRSTLSVDDRTRACRAHAGYFAAMASSAETHYRGPEATDWLDRLDANVENLRTAVTWLASEESGSAETSLRMATQLWEYFDLRNRHSEARAILTTALEMAPPHPSVVRARALALLGHTWLDHYEQAETFYRRSIEMVKDIPGAEPPFAALTGLMALAQLQGDLSSALALAQRFLSHARETCDSAMTSQALLSLGQIHAEAKEYDAATAFWAESYSLSLQLGDDVGVAWIQRAEGEMCFWQGKLAEAERLLLQAIGTLEQVGERPVIATCQLVLAKSAALQSDRTRAVTLLTQAVEEIAKGGAAFDTLEAIETGAIVLVHCLGRHDTALELFAAADRWRCITGTAERPHQQALVERTRRIAKLECSLERNVETASLRASIDLLRTTLYSTTALFEPAVLNSDG